MPTFVLNRKQQPNDDYEVHNKTKGCQWMPNPENQIDLGEHSSCHGAVAEAKRRYPEKTRTNGCATCCPECHTS